MSVGLEVPESANDLHGLVDGVAAPAALSQYLPVLEPGDDVFDAGAGSGGAPGSGDRR